MAAKDLPSEILDVIFLILFEESMQYLNQCALVCRNWKSPAQRLIFADVVFFKEQQALTVMETLKNGSDSPGLYMRSLSYNAAALHGNNQSHKRPMALFAETFPCLLELHWD